MENIIKSSKINELSSYNYYDDIILFSLKQLKSKKAYTKTYGTIQYINKIRQLNITKTMDDEKQKMEDSIFYINYLFQNTEDNETEKMKVLHKFYNLLADIFNKYIDVPKQALNLQKKFLDSFFIPKEEKANLEFYVKSLLN